MHISVSKTVLLDALQQVYKAVSGKPSIPILTGIFFSLTDECLSLTGSDMDFSIKVVIPLSDVRVLSRGSVVLPAKEALGIVKSMPNGDIRIEVAADYTTRFSSARTVLQITGMAPDDFPVLTNMDPLVQATLQGNSFRSLIKRSIFAAAASDKESPVINGVLIRTMNGTLCFTATDRKRAAHVSEIMDIKLAEELIIAASHLKLMLELLSDLDSITLSSDKNRAIIEQENVTIHASILNGRFPAIDQIISSPSMTEIVLNVEELSQALDRVKILADSVDSVGHIVRFDIKKEEVFLSSKSDTGHAEDVMNPSFFRGEELAVSFSAKHLLDALKTFDASEVRIQLYGKKSPCLLSSPERGDVFLVSPYMTR
jgi:DNA polymerase III subunit beta